MSKVTNLKNRLTSIQKELDSLSKILVSDKVIPFNEVALDSSKNLVKANEKIERVIYYLDNLIDIEKRK